MSEGRTYQKNNSVPFVVDQNSVIRTLGRQPNWNRFGARWKQGAVKVVVTAIAAADAVLIAVTAILGPLKAGEVIDFGGKKFARLTADVAAGVNSLPVAPLATALAVNDTSYAGGTGFKSVPAGLCVCEDATGKIIPRAEAAAETAYGYTETAMNENSSTDALTGYGVIRGGSLWENKLQDSTGNPKIIPAQWKTEMAANGAQFMYDQYFDSRAS